MNKTLNDRKMPAAGKIKKCRITQKSGNTYVMDCRIHQRGEHQYCYTPGSDRIKKHSGKELVIDEDGISVIRHAAEIYEAKVTGMKDPSAEDVIKTDRCGSGIKLYLKHADKLTYSVLIEATDESGTENTVYIDDIPGDDLLQRIHFAVDLMPENCVRSFKYDSFCWPKPGELAEHPVYIAALKAGDKHLKSELDIFYGCADSGTVDYLRKTTGHYYLYRLPEEYDRIYTVKADTVSAQMLKRSGYRILHRPYFAMRGNTHEIWELNPHTKTGVDAASSDADPISFAEYLEMFYITAPPF